MSQDDSLHEPPSEDEEALMRAFLVVYRRSRAGGRLAIEQFLAAGTASAGGTLVVQAPSTSAKRTHTEAGYRTEHWSDVLPTQ